MSELKNVEIQETENGYIVFSPATRPGTAYPSGSDTWVFETFEALVDFLKGAISKFEREEE